MSGKILFRLFHQQRHASCRIALASVLFLAFAAVPSYAQFTYWDRYDFTCTNNLGCAPYDDAQVTQGLDGNLYGTTNSGGFHAFGTIFMVTTLGNYTDLWQFDGVSGENPVGGLTLASDGNFYGGATWGGAFNNGTVFRFTPPSTLTVLHDFTGGSDGWNPNAPPVQGADGNLYGLTGEGTVYTIALATGTFTTLSQGSPLAVYAPLYLAGDGNLYGTSAYGGTYNQGTVFRVTTPSGAIKVLHNFTGANDGYNPNSPLVQWSDGYLYGTTLDTTTGHAGTIYRISPSGVKFKVIHQFSPCSGVGGTNADGGFPNAGLLFASDGNLYGVTSQCGANGAGTFYQVTSGIAFTKIFDFPAPSGGVLLDDTDNLMQHTNGSFFGLTSELGAGYGNLYNFTQPNLPQILTVAGPIFVLPGAPVEILGNSLTQVMNVNFAGVPATFRIGGDTQLTATVPLAAVDGAISATYVTGLQTQTVSSVHILPMITALDPLSGPVGTQVTISGGGFTGATRVTFGSVAATAYTVVSPTTIQATVPSGFAKAKVNVKTPNGKATSSQKFTVQ